MRIGVIQMRLAADISKNIDKILYYIKTAHRHKIELLCFPECAIPGYIVDHHKIKWEHIRNGIEKLQQASNAYDISLVVGTSWHYGNKIYNSAVIIRPNSPSMIYHKNNLTDYDKKYFSRGKSILDFDVNGIRCGVLICRDQNNPLLAMKYKHAKILFYLSSHYYTEEEAARKERKNKAIPIVRALENKKYVAKVDAVGKQNGLVSIGGSIVVDPEGHVIAEAKKGKEEILKFHL